MKHIILILIVMLSSIAHADQGQRLNEAEIDLAIALAKITANERSLYRPSHDEMAMIWQTIRRRGGDTAESRLEWLRRHSSCVFGELAPEERRHQPPIGSNCWWTWHLEDSDQEPANFTSEWPNYRSAWKTLRKWAFAIVAGREPSRGWPCRYDPDTWGGQRDRERARAAGMVALQCRGTANDGFVFERRARALRLRLTER